jgi:hypothetical protein
VSETNNERVRHALGIVEGTLTALQRSIKLWAGKSVDDMGTTLKISEKFRDLMIEVQRAEHAMPLCAVPETADPVLERADHLEEWAATVRALEFILEEGRLFIGKEEAPREPTQGQVALLCSQLRELDKRLFALSQYFFQRAKTFL